MITDNKGYWDVRVRMVLCVIDTSVKNFVHIHGQTIYSSFSVLIPYMSITRYILIETSLRSCYPLETPIQQMPSSWQGREKPFLCKVYFLPFSCVHAWALWQLIVQQNWPNFLWMIDCDLQLILKFLPEPGQHWAKGMMRNTWSPHIFWYLIMYELSLRIFPESGSIGSSCFTQLLSSMQLLGN